MDKAMRRFKCANREQPCLLPPTIDDYVGKNHFARYIVDIVDRLDLSKIYQEYSHRGSDPFYPKLLISLLFYGYCTGIFSTRKIETATYESLPFLYITGGLHPDHDTINTFRQRFLEQIGECFTEILLIAEDTGIFELGDIYLDGTKIKACASKHKAMSFDRMIEREKKLRSEVEELMKMAEDISSNESESLDIPAEKTLREVLLDRIEEAKKELKKRARERYEAEKEEFEEKIKQREKKIKRTGKKPSGKAPSPPEEIGPKEKDQYNFTDPDSRIMKTGDGFQQCYNAQAAADKESRLIVGHILSNHPNDKKELLPTLDSIPEAIGKVRNFGADNGYYSDNKQR